jgi:cytochrome c oxidase subunit 2
MMHTEDVNHALWIPGMRMKQDLLAGRVTDLRFTPIEQGVYRIVCAELCGSGHGNMAGEVTADGNLSGAWLIVHPDEETFLREFWNPEIVSLINPPDDPALLGRQILSSGTYPCAGCHRLDDLGWVGVTGPALNGIASRTQRLAATGYTTMEDYIRNSLRHPAEYIVPGYQPLMPEFSDDPNSPNYMPENQLEAIVAYLMTQTE